MLLVALLLLQGARLSGSQPGAPQNVTIIFLDSRTVRVLWSIDGIVDKYDVSYKPAEAKVVTVVAGNSAYVTLHDLQPDSQYQVTVTAVRGGVKARSRPIVFRTLAPLTEAPPTPLDAAAAAAAPAAASSADDLTADPTAIGSRYTPLTSVTVRGVEISLVLLALCVWIFAIKLFFRRWGKIRMLLPYQPDYKTQQALKVPGTTTSPTAEGPGMPDGPSCVQHLRWSSRYLDDPPRPASRWSSRQRLSVAAFAGYSPAATEDSPERMRHARSHSSLQRLSIPVPHQRRASRGSIHSLLDCMKAKQEAQELQPLFVVPDPQVRETVLDSPPRRYNPMTLRQQKTEEDKRQTTAEMKRKTFLRKISLQDTHINYNQDYWLEFEKSTRFHASLDLGYFETQPENKPKDVGPITIEPIQAISASIQRQSDLPLKTKPKFITRGDSEPYIVRKKCSCNECGPDGKRMVPTMARAKTNEHPPSSSSSLLANAIRSPSTENLPNLPFLERIGHIETEFETRSDSASSVFSEVSLNGGSNDAAFSPRSTTFDFEGGSAFFGEGPRTHSSSSSCSPPPRTTLAFVIPQVSVSRPSNSPSPVESATHCK